MRVFFIQGHGAACSISDYNEKDRVDFEKVFANIQAAQEKEYKWSHSSKIYTYNANKFHNISTQPVGRKSIFTIIVLLNKILSSQYRNVFLQGLINANKLEHLRILENIVHMYYSHYCIKYISRDDDKTISEYLKTSKLKQNTSHITNALYKFPKTDLSTSDIVNFMKYGYNYPPVNTEFHFETTVPQQGLTGIFELNEDNANDFIKLDDKIISTRTTIDNKLKMGLKLNQVYDFKGDIPVRAEEILKYNKALTPKPENKYIYTLEELMEHIYLVGNIKPDEHIVIFDNSCRGLKRTGPAGRTTTSSNTVDDLPPILRGMARIARMKSQEGMFVEELYGGSRRNKSRSKRSKKKKYKSNKI